MTCLPAAWRSLRPPAQVPLQELKRRAGIMFSGATGAAVASCGGGITEAPTYGLIQDVVTVVKELPPVLFDVHAEHRPCGLLDKYDAIGLLISDVIGLACRCRPGRWLSRSGRLREGCRQAARKYCGRTGQGEEAGATRR